MSDGRKPQRPLRSNFPRGSYLGAVRAAQWRNLGISEEDLDKPKIAIVNSSSELATCFSHLDGVAAQPKQAIRAAGALPFEIRTAAPSDFITGAGARGAYMLAARDLVTNDIEVAVEGAQLDGMVCLASCDKTVPGQAGGDAGQGFANNRAYGFGLDYLRGPLHVVASYLQLNNPSAGLASGNNPNGAIGDEYSGSTSIFYNAGFVERQRISALGAGYTFGAATVNFVATDTRLDYRGGHSLRVDNYELNGRYYFTPALTAGVGYIFTDGHGYTGSGATSFATGDRPRWHQVDAGISYLLSKRTDLHMSMVYQRPAGDASTVAINFFGPAGAGRNSQIAVLAGLRHRF
jgi:hypothetical protein